MYRRDDDARRGVARHPHHLHVRDPLHVLVLGGVGAQRALRGPAGGATSHTRVQQAPSGGHWQARSVAAQLSTQSIGLMQVPLTRKYVVAWRAVNNSGNSAAGVFDLDTGMSKPFHPRYEIFCNGPLILGDGRVIMVGGSNPQAKTMKDARNVITIFNNETNTIGFMAKMRYQRWYATPVFMNDGKVLIVGGTKYMNAGSTPPFAELFDPDTPKVNTTLVTMPDHFKKGMGSNWFPFMAQLPNGEILWWGDRSGSITTAGPKWSLITDLPPLPQDYIYQTMYPYTSSVALLPLKPDADGKYTKLSFVIFGGNTKKAKADTPASDLSARLDLYYCAKGICNDGWVIESMAGNRRVMGDARVLPNGKVIYHGGGQSGYAGWKDGADGYHALNPAANSLVYEPEKPQGSRYSLTANIGVPRLYHSAMCVDITGGLIISGCDSCGVPQLANGLSRSPDGDEEFRLSWGTPAEIATAAARPVITRAPFDIERGSTFTVKYTYKGTISGATLVAPCTSTHSLQMNQRVIFLKLESAADGVVTLRAPPRSQPAVAPFGYYMLFLLGDKTPNGNTYSQGKWVKLVDV